MFIRVKKVGNYNYAYLVENNWNHGKTNQKNKAYLGRVFKLTNPNLESVFNEELVDHLTNNEFKKGLHILLERCLKALGFQKKGNSFLKDSFIVKNKTVRANGKKAVLEINNGFLCDFTLNNLFSIKYDGEQFREWGFRLAKAISLSGIPISKEEFVALSARAISEYEINTNESPVEDFYY